MKNFIINACVLIGFALIIFGVYQFSLPWALIIGGLGVGAYGLLYGLSEVIKESKKEDK